MSATESDTDPDPSVEDDESVPEWINPTLDALYNLNKHAKKYARLGTENYRQGKKATAKANSVKKNALYAVKEKLLESLLDRDLCQRVERHEINGEEFWCCYFVDTEGRSWSFHSPLDCLDVDEEDHPLVDDVRTLDGFESDEEKERSSLSLKASLLHIEALGINTNDNLEQSHVRYGRNRHFVGWQYLGDGGELLSDGSPDGPIGRTAECPECGKWLAHEQGVEQHREAVHEGSEA